MILVPEIDSIILPCFMEYCSKANTRLNNQLIVICIFLGFILSYDNITWSLHLGLKIFVYCHMYVDSLVEWIVIFQFMNVVILWRDRFSLLNARLSNSSHIYKFDNSLQGFHLSFYKRTCTINIRKLNHN